MVKCYRLRQRPLTHSRRLYKIEIGELDLAFK